jgi:glucan phosphoethanolaminetransferase (alkaline phosphatase superfamily)
MTKQRKPTDIHLWTILYNVLLFTIACVCLFLIKRYPQYKFGLILLIVGIFAVMLHCGIRYMLYENYMKSLKKKQNENIIPKICPDYWIKDIKKGNVKCKNEFTTTDGGRTYHFGTKNTPKEYELIKWNNLKNQTKCWNLAKDNVSWMDLKLKCESAGFGS